MFYDRFEQLCKLKGVKPGRACTDMGLSRSLSAKWKNMGTKKPSAEVLEKMSSYFGISINEILDEDSDFVSPETQKAPTLNKKDELLDDDFIVLQRNLQNIPEADRKRIIRNFRDTVDIYLNRLGVENEKEEK